MADQSSVLSARHDALRKRADHLKATFTHASMGRPVDRVLADLDELKGFIDSAKVGAGLPLETKMFLNKVERKLAELESALKADGPDAAPEEFPTDPREN